MYAILIRFPFSSSNDEQYELVLYAAQAGQYANAIAAMNADTKCFRHLGDETQGTLVVQSYEGTLAGDVISEDNDREDVFVPLVESKLKFNMVCQQFPTWLMDLCDYYTNVKVMLVVKTGNLTIERWRGYLMANTLNMTVVNEMIACPLVAVDEVGIAKYIRFKDTYPIATDGASPTLLALFERWWKMHCESTGMDSRFDELYRLMDVDLGDHLYVARDLQYYDSASADVINLMALTVNVERWLLKRDVTWGDVLEDLAAYLGVVFSVGMGGPTGNDGYILSDADYRFDEYLTYTFGSTSYGHAYTRMFADFGNQQKVGADFQANYTPCEWKGVKVSSEPERPPVHEYLNKDNVQAIAPATGHGEWCETQLGKHRDNTTIDDFLFRVFQYTRLVDKEDQWIAEAEYVEMEDCAVSTPGRNVGIGQGYFPCTDSALGHNRPQADDVDSLDFALTKMGMITAKIGSYETPRQKVSADLKDYFVILNNNWGRLYFDDDTVVSSAYDRNQIIATFYPFAADGSRRPSNDSYLTIDFAAMFLNENVDSRIIASGAEQDDLQGTIQAVFPITESMYNWEQGPAGGDIHILYTGDMTATANNIVNAYFQPVLPARLSIGDFYWNGSYWEYVAAGSEPPTFPLRLTPTGATDKYWMISTGWMHGNVKNYYYEECRPRVGASDNVFRVPLSGLSVHGQPLEGQVRLELFGPVPLVNGYKPNLSNTTHWNNILFVLISDIKIEFTDEAYYSEKDIRTVATVETDPNSTTKKIKEVELNLSTPSVDGVFNNCLLYDDGKSWVNLQHVHMNGGSDETPEAIKAREMAAVYCGDQVTVEFSREFDGVNTDNIYNVGFTVSGLTEVSGTFMPLTRKFNWTKGLVRWKLQKVAD